MNPRDENSGSHLVWSPDNMEVFSRLPPGIKVPSIRARDTPALENAERLTATLDEYRDIFAQHALEMFSHRPTMSVTPGHPLYSQNATLSILREENSKLQQENAKLRESLERTAKKH